MNYNLVQGTGFSRQTLQRKIKKLYRKPSPSRSVNTESSCELSNELEVVPCDSLDRLEVKKY